MDMPMPVTLKMGDLMSEEEFFQFCQMNESLQVMLSERELGIVLPGFILNLGAVIK
jgi:hypothetical protein